MAFVFRSKKESQFDRSSSQLEPSPATHEPPSPSSIRKTQPEKGLPCNRYIDHNRDSTASKENKETVPPIHHRQQTHPTLHTPLAPLQAPPRQSAVLGSNQNIEELLRVREMGKQSKPSKTHLVFSEKTNQQPFRNMSEGSIHSQQNSNQAVNKSLLKALEHIKQKDGHNMGIVDFAGPNMSRPIHEVGDQRPQGWRSLKKFAPLGEVRTSKQTICADLSLLTEKAAETVPLSRRKKNKLRIKKVSIMTRATAEDSESEDEYESGATPGPGSYDFQPSRRDFRSQRDKFKKIFYSQLDRFNGNSKGKFQEVTYVNEDSCNNSPSKPVCQSFLSKSPKFADLGQNERRPAPGSYNTRQTLEHDLVRHLMKASNSKTFINNQRRVPCPSGGETPGPGSYQLDNSQQILEEQRNQLTSCYRSSKERQLDSPRKTHKSSTSKDNDFLNTSEHKPIHVKDQVKEEWCVADPPPFMSGSIRFPEPEPDTRVDNQGVKLPSKKEENVLKQPFNSSSERAGVRAVGEGVGVGLYELGVGREWTKKSYNMLYN